MKIHPSAGSQKNAKRNLTTPLMAVSMTALWSSPASAADYTWLGGTGLWNTSNWTDGVNTVTGPTSSAHTAIINSGTVKLSGHDIFGNGGAATATTAIQVNNGATLDTNGTTNPIVGLALNGGNLLINGGHSSTWGGVRLSGTLTVGGSAASTISSTGDLTRAWIGVGNNTTKNLTLSVADATGDANADLTIHSQMIEGNWGSSPQGVIKTGGGTLVLANANNTYTGNTLVSAGTLLVTGALANSSVTVGSNGTVGGGGTIGGTLSFDSGAKFAFNPGQTLTVNGASVTFGNFGVANLFGLDNSVNVGTYTLIDGTATINWANVSNVGSAYAYDLGAGKSAYFKTGSMQLVIEAIPEPSAALLGGLGLLALLRRRRA